MHFLSGLNDDFDVVKTQILMMDPLSDINKVYSLVAQHERRTNPDLTDDSQAFVNATDSTKSFYKGKGFVKICDYCGRTGHTKDFCYKLHGPPTGNRAKPPKSLNNVVGDPSARLLVKMRRVLPSLLIQIPSFH